MKRVGVNYDSVDWSLSNAELAELLGVRRRTVAQARQRRGIPLAKPGFGRGNKNATIDWRLSPKTQPIRDPDYEFAFKNKGGGRRGGGKSWADAVRAVYGDACQCCGYLKPPITNHAHHIVPISEGGKNTINNGIVLCSRCHEEVHAGIRKISI